MPSKKSQTKTETPRLVVEYDPDLPESVKLGSPEMFGIEYADGDCDPARDSPD